MNKTCVGCRFSAHSDGYACFFGVFDRHFDKAKHCRLSRVIQLGNSRISSVNSHGIAGKVVCSYGEKRNLFCKQIRNNRRRRSFNHNAYGNVGKPEPVVLELVFALFDKRFCFTNLVKRRYKRKHNLYISENCGTENRTKLGFENFRIVKTVSYRTVTEERVVLFFDFKVIYRLVSADIERADYNFLAVHCLCNGRISFILLLLGRKRASVHKQEFRSEKSDTLAAVLQYVLCVLRLADIAVDTLFDARFRNGFL